MEETAKPYMYRLINPDPLKGRSQRVIAQAAGCSQALVSNLVMGYTEIIGGDIALEIERVCGMKPGEMFEKTDRIKWAR